MSESRLTFELFGRDKASPVFDKFGRRVEDTHRKVGLLESGTRKLVGAAAGYVAFSTAADFLRSANEEARESQKVGAQTTQVIKSTGGAAKVTAEEVGDLATRLSNKTAVDDEQVQSSTNLLLTFKRVRNEVGEGAKILDRATEAALDLSASGFGSTESAAKMLGKALNDPLKGITALSRAGVTFSEDQKRQIAAYVQQNDLLSAQKIILKEVESQVGGQAAAQATAAEKASVAWANVKETIGTALLPTIDRMSEKFVDFVENHDIEGWAENAADGLETFFEEAEPLARDVLPAIGTALGIAADAAQTLAPAVQAVVDAFNNMPKWAQTVLVGGALVKGTGIGKLVPSIGGAAGGAAAGAVGRSAGQAAAAAGGAAAGGAAKFGAGRALGVVGIASALGSIYNDKMLDSLGDAQEKARRGTALTNKEMREQARLSNEIFGNTRRSGGGDFDKAKRSATEFTKALDELASKNPEPRVGVLGVPNALSDIGQVLGEVTGLDKKKAEPRVKPGNIGGSLNALADVGSAIGRLDRRRAQPRVRVDTSGVAGQVRYVQRLINSVTGKTVGIRVASGGRGGTTTARATGGPIIGPGSGTSDDVLFWGSNGEHVLTADEVSAMGGQQGVYNFRRRLRGEMPGRRDGGPIGDARPGGASLSTAAVEQLLSEQNQLLRTLVSARGSNMRLTGMGG